MMDQEFVLHEDDDDITTPRSDPDDDTLSPRHIWGFVLCISLRMALAWAFMMLVAAFVPRILLTTFVFTTAAAWAAVWCIGSEPPFCWALLGGARPWWQYMRPLHAGAYLAAGTLAWLPQFRAHAWIPIAVDTALAAIAWLAHHVYST